MRREVMELTMTCISSFSYSWANGPVSTGTTIQLELPNHTSSPLSSLAKLNTKIILFIIEYQQFSVFSNQQIESVSHFALFVIILIHCTPQIMPIFFYTPRSHVFWILESNKTYKILKPLNQSLKTLL